LNGRADFSEEQFKNFQNKYSNPQQLNEAKLYAFERQLSAEGVNRNHATEYLRDLMKKVVNALELHSVKVRDYIETVIERSPKIV
jgi:hypothetical protein